MEILLVSLGYFKVLDKTGGGVDFYTYNLANSLGKLGCEVHYLANLRKEAENKLNENVFFYPVKHSFPLKTTFLGWSKNYFLANYYMFKEVNKVIEKIKFDIINGHGNLSTLLLSLKFKQSPIIYTFYNPSPKNYFFENLIARTIRKMMFSLIEKPLWYKVQHIIAISNLLEQELIEFGIEPQKIDMVPTGVDTNLFKPTPDSKDYIQEKYDFEDYCLFVGQLVKRKGVHFLLEALSRNRDIKCIIVGDGPQYKELTSISNKYGLEDTVKFVGSVPLDDLIILYSNAKFFVFPSLSEGGNPTLAVLEAMSCGTPVISTTAAANSDVIKDGINGFLVEPFNVKHLEEKIRYLWENSDLCIKMGKNARKTVKERYRWDMIAKQTVVVYEKVLEEKR